MLVAASANGDPLGVVLHQQADVAALAHAGGDERPGVAIDPPASSA